MSHPWPRCNKHWFSRAVHLSRRCSYRERQFHVHLKSPPKTTGKDREKTFNPTTATAKTSSKSSRFNKGDKNSRHVHHAFLYISLPSLHEYDMKLPFFFAFCVGRKQASTEFSFSFLNLDMVLSSVLGSKLQGVCLHLNLTKWVGIIVVLYQ